MTGSILALSVAWLLSYEGKSTNELVWDSRTHALVQTRVPAKLSRALIEALGGPPDPVFVRDGRYVSLSACAFHACGEKGFLWVDTRSGVGLGAVAQQWQHLPKTLILGSNAFAADAIPAAARTALLEWLSERDVQPASVTFVDRSGRETELEVARFTPPEKFQPPLSGPSFDCARAATRIETAICNDGSLSKADLELSRLYREIRHGHDTVGVWSELAEFERSWVRSRDAECGGRADVVPCLLQKYQQQHDALWNWLPSHQR